MSKIKILAIPSDKFGVGKFRILDPFRYIGDNYSDEIHVDISFNPEDNDDFFKDYNVVVFHSFVVPTTHEANIARIKWLKEKGIKTVMDIDDLWFVDMRHPMYHQVKEHKIGEKKIEMLRLVDHITTTTTIFANTIKEKLGLKNTTIFPNAVNHEEPQFQPKPFKSDKIRFGWLGGSCMTPDTEILTDNGWIRFDQLDKTEKVATLNPNTNEIEYHKPSGYICEPFKGNLNCGKNKLIEYEVTPNHNMYASEIKHLGHKKLNLGLVQSEKIHGKNFHVKRDAIWNGIEKEFFTLPSIEFYEELELETSEIDNIISKKFIKTTRLFNKYGNEKEFEMDDWLKFFGFWMAEGWTSKTKGLHQVGIAQIKDNNYLETMFNLLEKMGFKPIYSKDKKQIRIFDKQLWYYLSQFGYANDKFIPKDLKELSSRQLNIFLEWFINGDGNIENNIYKRKRAWSSSKSLIDDLQEISLKIGLPSTIKNRGKRTSYIKGRQIINQFDSYQINFSKNPNISKHNKSTPLVKSNEQYQRYYNGFVYCVEVTNHIIYVRRNGKPFWIGNSHLHDLELLRNGISSIQHEKPENTQFVLCGFDTRGTVSEFNPDTKQVTQRPIKPEETVWYKYEQIFTDNYRVTNPTYETYLKSFTPSPEYKDDNETYRRRWTLDVAKYAINYNYFDISLAPLAESHFNANKSQLKVIEAGFHKKALIASNVKPYNLDLISAVDSGKFNDKGNALLVDPNRNHKDWGKHMKRLVDNPNMIEDLGNRLYETVKDKFALRNVCKDRVEFFKTITQ